MASRPRPADSRTVKRASILPEPEIAGAPPAEAASESGAPISQGGVAAAHVGLPLSEHRDSLGINAGSGGNGTSGAALGAGVDSGEGSGTGSGSASTSASRGATLTQARYHEAPRPAYPESARRAGQEGRVLLRVLVDEGGRSKRVEINSSSGSEALDRAAAEAIRRWRFEPARYGDQPIESWLRIPIEFRLTDASRW